MTFEISGNVNPNPEARIEVKGSKNRNLSALQYMCRCDSFRNNKDKDKDIMNSASFTDNCDRKFLLENMMGPNAMRIAEELTAGLPMPEGMRILDLGCGMGISSVLLAEKYGATVFAADLWIAPTDNAARFAGLGLDRKIIPVSVDAVKDIPFAHGYFDMIVSVDAYQYFGGNGIMLGKLLPFVRRGGLLAVAVPGFVEGVSEDRLPDEVKAFWTPEWHFHSCSWWRALWEKEAGLDLVDCREMSCCEQAWREWLDTDNPHAKNDRAMMDAGCGKYFSLVQLVARKR